MLVAEATDAAIIEGGGFGWVEPQGRAALERHFRGVLLVPERELFVARLDGHAVGSALLVRPPRNNEAQAFAATLTHAYVAPYARGFGLARLMVTKAEERAAALGHRVINLDVRETQATAIALLINYPSMDAQKARIAAHLDAGCDVVLVCHPDLVDESLRALDDRRSSTMSLIGLMGRGPRAWDELIADARYQQAQLQVGDVPVSASDAGAASGAINVGDVA